MVRPLRLEFAGAWYHVTSRGGRREDIYLDDEDRQEWLTVLAEVCDRFNWVVHAYCEMSNYYQSSTNSITDALQDFGNELVWGRQMDELIKRCKCKK